VWVLVDVRAVDKRLLQKGGVLESHAYAVLQ
jgi:hypothetical protein